MIKPFKIINTIIEPDGGTGVTFQVSKVTQISNSTQEKQTVTSYISVPPNTDIDRYIFDDLKKAGWF